MQKFIEYKQILQQKKLWEPLTYLFFGGLTTVVNIVVYLIFREGFGFYYQKANVISWIASVLFAYFTNKLWVFEAKTKTKQESWAAFGKFIFFRVISLGLDMLCMYFFISVLATGDLVAKLVTQVVVVLANYVFSKFLIFNTKKSEKK
ncbi:GtrA family protein [Enterococcus casseliflavus]|uniref:GtrA family protein n=1 Tax=Enterococcus casseliflavus TaxID=37734 RepID=UPI0023DCC45C|nr:GtrA family protein [Enterococcus casseliflavus]WEL48641.1 GtrA family protein [Enterococcus casseliflavus]